DNLTGLVWKKNANLPNGSKTWQVALDYVAGMNAGTNPNFGYADWRLPNVNELKSLIDNSKYAPSLPQGHPFTNVQSDDYWSSTTNANGTDYAWIVCMYHGDVYDDSKSHGLIYYAWPVRSGQCGSFGDSVICLPKTGQTISYAIGDDGDLETGVAWPDTRFTDKIDGTVKDNLTGLVWTKNANLPNGTLTWQGALDYVAGMNAGTNPNFGYTDWRLPNVNELKSLIDNSKYAPSLPQGHPFTNVQSNGYWSSTTYAFHTDYAWIVYMSYGYVNVDYKSYFSYYAWPVRSGQGGVIYNTQMSADDNCQSKDVFNTSPTNLEPIYVSSTLPIPIGTYIFYLVKDKVSWNDGDTVCSPNCVTSKSIAIDSNGHFCDLLWTPPVGDNNVYDIVLDVNGNGKFDAGIDFVDSNNEVGATTTLVTLTSFTATPKSTKVILDWNTESEIDNAGFNLYRSESENGNYSKINTSLIPAQGSSTQGASYEYVDSDVQNRKTYYYKLEDIDNGGISTFHGPVKAVPRAWK
ncbi:MAG: DUF1566 domain-containing protein, partial [Proteobacteria bacterium]|nr:DUF1566 domain-containing protein [Pseudomonadota bacterium]